MGWRWTHLCTMLKMNWSRLTASGTVLLAVALSGCGGSGGTPSETATQASNVSEPATTATSATTPAVPAETSLKAAAAKTHFPKLTIKIVVPGVSSSSEKIAIPVRYTCDGADQQPAVHWSNLPRGTKELVLFLNSFEYTAPNGGPLIYWAVAGLTPSSSGVPAGKLPASAIVGRNSAGQSRYNFCPAKGGEAKQYVMTVFALGQRIASKPGFSGEALYAAVKHAALAKGLTGFSYKRS